MNKPRKFPVRRWLEIVGTVLLVYGIYSQRDVLGRSLTALRHADTAPLLACLLLTWSLFLWSAIGYKLLLEKPVRLWHIMLAHLAAGGPGRVIPGGAGQLSFGTLFLKKQGLSLPQAIAVALSNNLSGFIVNTIVLIVIFALDPDLVRSFHLSLRSLSFILLLIAALLFAALVARRSQRVKKGTDGMSKELKKVWARLGKKPLRLSLLILTMLATILTNTLMLYFAAHAVGLQLTLGTAMIAISTGVALGSLVPTPGGIGGVEAGLIASMYALGFDLEMATSAALLYRFATYILPFTPGIFAYLFLRKKELL